MAIALADDRARSHDLPTASRFPGDNDKGTYFIKTFHPLHCLSIFLNPIDDREVLLMRYTEIDAKGGGRFASPMGVS